MAILNQISLIGDKKERLNFNSYVTSYKSRLLLWFLRSRSGRGMDIIELSSLLNSYFPYITQCKSGSRTLQVQQYLEHPIHPRTQRLATQTPFALFFPRFSPLISPSLLPITRPAPHSLRLDRDCCNPGDCSTSFLHPSHPSSLACSTQVGFLAIDWICLEPLGRASCRPHRRPITQNDLNAPVIIA